MQSNESVFCQLRDVCPDSLLVCTGLRLQLSFSEFLGFWVHTEENKEVAEFGHAEELRVRVLVIAVHD